MPSFFSSLFSLPPGLAPIFASIWTVWGYTWWIILPIVTAAAFWEAWHLYLHVRWLSKFQWMVLEIKIPKNVLKTPKAMEQIFAAAHTPYNYGLKWYQKHLEGKDEDFMSFELVGRAGETHFYLRLPKDYRKMMESAIYGQYPEAQVVEVEDYLKQMPHTLPNKDLDVEGFEEVFGKPEVYPIRTYPMFEDPVEERRVDTMGSFVEALSKMNGDQQFWMQLVIVPAGIGVQEEGEKTINELLGIEDKKEKKGGIGFDLGFTFAEALRAPFEHPSMEAKKDEKKQERLPRFIVPPNKKELADGIQRKIGKLTFESTLRFLYIERRGETPEGGKHTTLAHAYIRQFNTHDMNQLRPDKTTTTASYAVHGAFKKMRIRWRKRVLYERYQHLTHQSKPALLNIEELATIYHFPTAAISTTELAKVESRTGTPPASLPVIDETTPPSPAATQPPSHH
jgi:hypothetical protein